MNKYVRIYLGWTHLDHYDIIASKCVLIRFQNLIKLSWNMSNHIIFTSVHGIVTDKYLSSEIRHSSGFVLSWSPMTKEDQVKSVEWSLLQLNYFWHALWSLFLLDIMLQSERSTTNIERWFKLSFRRSFWISPLQIVEVLHNAGSGCSKLNNYLQTFLKHSYLLRS